MGIKEQQLRREFDLCARAAKTMGPLPTKADGSAHSAEMSLDLSIQQSLSWALKTSMDIHNKDLSPYCVAVPLPDGEQDSYSFTIYMTDEKKGDLLTQPALYDDMERFIRRVLKEADNTDTVRAQTDYTNHHITLHYQPMPLIETLHQLTHKIYRGNETILGHLYMAQHMMDWQKDYRPKLQIN